MTYGEHIRQLRASGRDPKFCLQVTPELLSEMIKLLLNEDLLVRSQRIDLLATISNILLINRNLHTSYFTNYWSSQVLEYLNDFLMLLLHEFDDYQDNDRPSVYDFKPFLVVYRLIFLILYDGVSGTDSWLEDTDEGLNKGLETMFSYFGKYNTDAVYSDMLIEILKGLYTLFHKYSDQFSVEDDTYTEKYIEIIIRTKNQDFKNMPPKKVSLIRYFINLILVASTTQERIKFDDVLKKFDSYKDYMSILIKFLERNLYEYEHSETFDISDVVNLFIIINFIGSEYNRSEKHLKENPHLIELMGIFSNSILPVEFTKPTDTQEPNLGSTNFIHNKCINIIKKAHAASASHFSFTEQTALSHASNVILQCYFNLCHSSDCDTQVKKFLDVVGYRYARNFMTHNHVELPEGLDIAEYLSPNPKYLCKSTKDDPPSAFSSFSKSLTSILNEGDMTPKAGHEEMTHQEKEIEAEKLFGIFDKMEKSSAFENFTNPIREWQQAGKFEDLDLEDEEQD